jgi:hypothetical protein
MRRQSVSETEEMGGKEKGIMKKKRELKRQGKEMKGGREENE